MDMNLHAINGNQFSHYSDKSVTIGDIVYTHNILVTNNKVFDFAPSSIEEISLNDLAICFELTLDLIILGSGNKVLYPDLKLLTQLQQRGIGVEVMSIKALCRTFNFLTSEDRKVAGVLLFL